MSATCLTSTVFLVLFLKVLSVTSGDNLKEDGLPPTEYEYCIIGAGPAGVQLGHFFLEANRSYRIFEKSAKAGSFFAKDGRSLPIHRKLISINKRVTGSTDPEFNMRMDWNSLLGDHVPRVTNRSKRLWPDAQIVADYIHDFAGIQIAAGKLAFGTEVSAISRIGGKFHLQTSSGSTSCKIAIVASGLQSPRPMQVHEELVHGYETLTKDMEQFEGKQVIVLGGGNAAFETVEALQDIAQVFLVKRSSVLPWKTKARNKKRMDNALGTRFAMMTHYVGDVRAPRLGIFDSYELKMADRIMQMDPSDTVLVLRCMGDRRCAFHSINPADLIKKNALNLKLDLGITLSESVKDLTEAAVLKYIKSHPRVKLEDFQIEGRQPPMENLKSSKNSMPFTRFTTSDYAVQIRRRVIEMDPDLFPFLMRETNSSVWTLESSAAVFVADAVIRCYGWKMDASIFDEKTIYLQTSHKGKYPKIHDTYEAKSVPGLFFAGSLAHSLDFRKSAGGFIHGFRYSARALFRYFEESREGVRWPSREFDLGSNHGVEALIDHILYRFNIAAGPYQMFGGTLLDGLILSNVSLPDDLIKSGSCSADGLEEPGVFATYYEEMPPSTLYERLPHFFRLVWFFEYGKDFHGPQVLYDDNVGATDAMLAQHSTFLHPRMQLWAPDKSAPALEHWVLEDFSFTFKDYASHKAPLTKFIMEVIEHVRPSLFSGARTCEDLTCEAFSKQVVL